MKKAFQRIAASIATLVLVLVPLHLAHAANVVQLYFDPAVTSAEVNTTFSVNVMLKSPDDAVGYVKAYVSFPQDKFIVTAISTANSKFSTQIEQSADNTNGYAKIARSGSLQQGSALLVASITFQTKATGVGAVNFTSSSYVSTTIFTANKLTSTVGGSYNVTAATTPPTTNPPSGGGGTGGSTGGSTTPPSGGSTGSTNTNSGSTSAQTGNTGTSNNTGGSTPKTNSSSTTARTNTPANNATNDTPADPNKLAISNTATTDEYNQTTLTWATNAASASTLTYGTDQNNLDNNQSNAQQETNHTAALKDLLPGTKYYYHIEAKSADGQEATYNSDFTTKGFPVTIMVTSANGKAVRGAEVSIDGTSVLTDGDGNAIFNLPSGQLDVAILSGHLKKTGSVNVEAKDIPSDGSDPETQSFSFSLPKDNSMLIIIGTAGLGGLLLIALLALLLRKRRSGVKVTAPSDEESLAASLYDQPNGPEQPFENSEQQAPMVSGQEQIQTPFEQPEVPVMPTEQPLPTTLPPQPEATYVQAPTPPTVPEQPQPQPQIVQLPPSQPVFTPEAQLVQPSIVPQPPIPPAPQMNPQPHVAMPQPVQAPVPPVQSFSPLPPEAQHEDLPHMVARTTPTPQKTQEDLPKDMFELAEEQYHYDEKFKTPQHPTQ